jgi:hypothetical protein
LTHVVASFAITSLKNAKVENKQGAIRDRISYGTNGDGYKEEEKQNKESKQG